MFRAFLVWAALCCTAAAGETLVAFTARWCGPCQRFHRDHERNPRLAGDIQVRVVDVDDNRQEARQYRIRSMPTFVLEKDGQEIRRTSGYSGPDDLKEWVAGH